jgi:hypothetical protein
LFLLVELAPIMDHQSEVAALQAEEDDSPIWRDCAMSIEMVSERREPSHSEL